MSSQNSNLSGYSGKVMASDNMSSGSAEDRDREKLDGGNAKGMRFSSDPSKIRRSQFSRNVKGRASGSSGGAHNSHDGAIIQSKGKEISKFAIEENARKLVNSAGAQEEQKGPPVNDSSSYESDYEEENLEEQEVGEMHNTMPGDFPWVLKNKSSLLKGNGPGIKEPLCLEPPVAKLSMEEVAKKDHSME